jgi:5-methyltetrahydropteroyltriglutamate--homocysteine methyltransferase
MPDNAHRILTTHVGSLIRPPKLVEFWRAIEDGKPYDEAAFEACLTQSVAEVVRQQAEIGIDIVSDGEFSKGANWAFYVHKRLSGITVRPATPEEAKDPMASMGGGRDHQAFPDFYAEYDAASGLDKRLGNRVVVNGPIRYSKQQVARDIQNLKAGVAKAKNKHPSLAAFLPVVAPASALPGAKNEHYKDEETYLTALADALHEEYKAIVDAGLLCANRRRLLPLHARAHGAADDERAISPLGAAAH